MHTLLDSPQTLSIPPLSSDVCTRDWAIDSAVYSADAVDLGAVAELTTAALCAALLKHLQACICNASKCTLSGSCL